MPTTYVEPLVRKLPKELIEKLADENKDWAQAHGVCMRLSNQENKSDLTEILPFSLVPSLTPKKLFLEAYAIQNDFNFLYHKIAMDFDFIKNSLAKVVQTDQFTARLLAIYQKITEEQCLYKIQPNVLTIQRCDYMFQNNILPSDHPKPLLGASSNYVLKQVEVNNIAAGGAVAGSKITKMHKATLQQWPYIDPTLNLSKIPENDAIGLVVNGLVSAYTFYDRKQTILLVIIEELNRYIMDQRYLEYEFSKKTNGAKIRRLTLTQCIDQIRLDENQSNRLFFSPENLEVAVVYFRSGYLPEHYPSEKEWEARLKIERSAAIKCPFIGSHLAGTKMIQQVLSNIDLNEKFSIGPAVCARLKKTFAKMYHLDVDDPETEKIKLAALNQPENFVLKPQLEGGGNNLFGQKLVHALESFEPKFLEAYILMERLNPMVHENILVMNQQPSLEIEQVDSELGIFGFTLGTNEAIVKEAQYGHILRTKPNRVREGGLGTGTSVHDAPFLM